MLLIARTRGSSVKCCRAAWLMGEQADWMMAITEDAPARSAT
jgi:hypothetical protein